MKVAIIGAGISGLSCAIELKRHGITPTIFEKTETLGDKPGQLVASLRLFYRSIRSPMSFFSSKYKVDISPLHPINEMVMITPNKTVSAKGNHGSVFIKGIDTNSIEHQLISQCNIPVTFDTHIKIPNIKNDFDHIVVATGNNVLVKDLNLWNTTFMAKVRIATVSGSFKPNTMIMWLNKSLAKNGYAYLLARNSSEAELALAVSDITMDKLDYYWNEFLIKENLKYSIIKSHDLEHTIGYPSTNQFENIYFIGNSGGMIDDFLGFGMLRGIESGILAARAIVDNLDLNKLLEPRRKEVKQLYEYRKMINVLSDKDYDRDMGMLGLPILKHMIYNNPFYKATQGILVPKIVIRLKKEGYKFELDQRKKL